MCIFNDKVNNMYLIGAGFDKAVFGCDVPLNDEVLCRLIEQNNFLPELKQSIDLYQQTDYAKNDIEMYLTWLDTKVIGGSQDAKKIRKEITEKIANYFIKFNFAKFYEKNKQSKETNYKYNVEWCEKFVTQVLKNNDIIINLNYTTFLEGLLDNYEFWNLRGGYSSVSNWVFEEKLENNNNIKNIIIYKIHGSVSFCYELSGNDLQIYVDEQTFPKTYKKVHPFGDYAKTYIIAPSYIKIPHKDIRKIIVEAIEKVKYAKKLIIMGCGLRDEDYLLKLILQSFFSRESQKKVVIVDPNADEITARVLNTFDIQEENIEKKYNIEEWVSNVIKKDCI
ncbi:SIR2 family protein [bacterium]